MIGKPLLYSTFSRLKSRHFANDTLVDLSFAIDSSLKNTVVINGSEQIRLSDAFLRVRFVQISDVLPQMVQG